MGHRITALVAKLPISEERAKELDVPVIKENGFAILGLHAIHSDYWANKLDINNESNNKIILDCPLTHFLGKEIVDGKYALIETDYFGGIGEQAAGVFYNGEVVLPVAGEAINDCLREIGVYKIGKLDEFDSISLSNYRNFDDYFEKYWDM